MILGGIKSCRSSFLPGLNLITRVPVISKVLQITFPKFFINVSVGRRLGRMETRSNVTNEFNYFKFSAAPRGAALKRCRDGCRRKDGFRFCAIHPRRGWEKICEKAILEMEEIFDDFEKILQRYF